jgi:putative aminopeptidase FrvX
LHLGRRVLALPAMSAPAQHERQDTRRSQLRSRAAIILVLLFSLFGGRPATGQTGTRTKVPRDLASDLKLASLHPVVDNLGGVIVEMAREGLASDLKEFVETPSVSGYENQLSEKIRAKVAAFHPVVDNLGDVIVTIGSGAPHRLIVTPIDEPGFVVSGITDDGYLRLQRLPQSGLPPIFNELYSAQPVKVGIAGGKWIDGVVAGISVHLHRAGENLPSARDIENLYVDIGASSAAEARKAGVDILSPVAIDRGHVGVASGRTMADASIGDKFGAAAVVELLRDVDPAKIEGTLTVAFIVQQRIGGRGLQRVFSTTQADEVVYVGRMLAGGNVQGMQGVHRAPRREPGSGVLVGLDQAGSALTRLAADLKQLADTNKIPFATDYSAGIFSSSYLTSSAFPTRWAHVGVAVAWPDTPVELLNAADLSALVTLLAEYVPAGPRHSPSSTYVARSGLIPGRTGPLGVQEMLQRLVQTYGASGHEGPVVEAVKGLLPEWTKPETDDSGNLILHLGTAPAGAKTPKILIIAHMDEIGFDVKSISNDGRLEVTPLGGMDLSFYQGHPMLVHTSSGDRDAIMELPPGWDEPNFKWPLESTQPIRVDVGARSPEEVAKLGIRVGDSITIPKEYRPLLGTRANGRSFDDRVGDAALISAVWALGGPLKDRDVTFVWSTREEVGLLGAGALAKRLAAEGRTPDYVFAVDTLVSSDSPLESKRFADAELGKGFAVRAVDSSNIVPRELADKVVRLARANQIPVQLGVTGGGNDGSAFVPYGSVDIALGWPLRYSHSPAEVIDTRDVDALARIIAVIARSW